MPITSLKGADGNEKEEDEGLLMFPEGVKKKDKEKSEGV